MVPPLVLDIDGTLTRGQAEQGPSPIDPRLFDRLRGWAAPVILATGKAFPFPVALSQFIGLDTRIIAETGGIICTDHRLEVLAKTAEMDAIADVVRERYPTAVDDNNLINRWRETELAFLREMPLDGLESIAEAYGYTVVDTGYAYHVKDANISKGLGLEHLASWEDIDLAACVAIGDSPNDISLFERVGTAVAVDNATPPAKAAADYVTSAGQSAGTLGALDQIERDGFS